MIIKKINEDEFEIESTLIEKVSIKDLENQIKGIEAEQSNFEEKNKMIFDTQKEFSEKIEKLKDKIKELNDNS